VSSESLTMGEILVSHSKILWSPPEREVWATRGRARLPYQIWSVKRELYVVKLSFDTPDNSLRYSGSSLTPR